MGNPTQETHGGSLVPRLGGLNQRARYTNPNPAEFDELIGYIQQRSGVLGRPPGSYQLQIIPGRKILGFCQTFDNRKNVLVQTDYGIYLYSEDELMGRVIPTNLVRAAISDEENMAKAIIVHTAVLGANGGSYNVANTWQQSPLTAILSQLNPDGTPAAFVTALAANVFTLAAGTYRFNGWRRMSDATAGRQATARLFNVTAGLPAWNGLANQQGPIVVVESNNSNVLIPVGGDLTIAGPTNFQLEGYMSDVQLNTGFGFPRGIGAGQEVYAWLEILKTA